MVEIFSPFGLILIFICATWIIITVPLNNILSSFQLAADLNDNGTEDQLYIDFHSDISLILNLALLLHYCIPCPLIIIFFHSFIFVILFPQKQRRKNQGYFATVIRSCLKNLRGFLCGFCFGFSVTVMACDSVFTSFRKMVERNDQVESKYYLLLIHMSLASVLFVISTFSSRILELRDIIVQNDYPDRTGRIKHVTEFPTLYRRPKKTRKKRSNTLYKIIAKGLESRREVKSNQTKDRSDEVIDISLPTSTINVNRVNKEKTFSSSPEKGSLKSSSSDFSDDDICITTDEDEERHNSRNSSVSDVYNLDNFYGWAENNEKPSTTR